MLRKASVAIIRELDKAGLKYDTIERDGTSVVVCAIGGKVLDYKIQFISTDDDNDVALRIFDLVKYNSAKRDSVLNFLNTVNAKYRYVKFVMAEKDRTVQIECDFPQKMENVGPVAIEYIVRIMRILDECGNDLMKTLWA